MNDTKFIVLDEHFAEREIDLQDHKVTGAQIVAAAGFRSPEQVIVLQQLTTGALLDVGPDESVDLRATGIERFFVMEGDATYRFVLDGLKMQWPRRTILADALRRLAGKDERFVVVHELDTVADRTLDLDTAVELGPEGVERFKTVVKSGTLIYVNTHEHRVHEDELGYDAVVRLAYPQGPFSEEWAYTVTYSYAHGGGGELVTGGKPVKVKKEMSFVVGRSNRS